MEPKKEKKINKWEEYIFEEVVKNVKNDVVREYRFHETRRWRFDIAIPLLKIAIECEGGTWTGGRHVNPIGFEKDLEKYNTATLMGWKVYRFTPRMLKAGDLEKMLCGEYN